MTDTAIQTLFTSQEFDALFLGLFWAMDDEEASVADAAESALDKLAGLLPEPTAEPIACPEPNPDDPAGAYWVPFLQSAAEAERSLSLVYRDKTGAGSSRVVWPLLVDTWRQPAALVAWCETRDDFRVFRVDRIQSLALEGRYPERRQVLTAKWQMQEDEE